ncbi:MAG: hypothetical protein KUL75_01990 [Sterolibacterium sp.]|nr:hypothetical protein [Sterolibacterium sp.]
MPGLLWPEKLRHEAVADLALPALAWLLGHARLTWQAPRTLEASLCQIMGCGEDTEPPAFAALRRLGEQQDAETHDWLCADPVHLALEKRRITLDESCPPASDEELQAIAAALQQLLHEEAALAQTLGIQAFHPGQNGRGYLQLARAPDMQSTPPSAASGFESMQPQGREALPWRRFLNHAQMRLHALPCNQQRLARHQPPLNSLWLWGAGKLPASQPGAPYTMLHGDHPLLAGLARWAQIRHANTRPASAAAFFNAPAHGTLLLLDQLHAAARQYDMLQWREQMLALERHWLQPLQQACAQGRLQQLRITAPGDDHCLDIHLQRSSRWQLWRRPRTLQQLPWPP